MTRFRHVFAFLLIFVITLFAYSNSFRASWHLDDESNITENRQIQITEISWSQLKASLQATPSHSKISFLRPISRLSLALNYYFCQEKVFGYHVFNLSVHILTSVFLYLFVLSTLRLPLLKNKDESQAFWIAFLSAAFWAIHPIQTQAVTYIVQRMASMAAMFYIMAMYLYVRSLFASTRSKKTILFFLTCLAGLLALGTKENAILLPLSIFTYHVLLVKGVDRSTWRSLEIFALFYFVPLLIGSFYLELSSQTVTKVFALYEIRPFTVLERLLTESRALVLYISLLLYPIPNRFSIDHDITISTSLLTPPSTFFSILLILSILAAGVLLARRNPILSFSVFFFFLNHAIESTVIPMELVFEHRNYLPSMPVFIPVAVGIVRGHFFLSRNRAMQSVIGISAVLLLILLGHSTFVRNAIWENELSLWQDVLQKNPNSFRAHHNLGRYYSTLGEERAAILEYVEALHSRAPHTRAEKAMTFFNLGYQFHIHGDYQTAFNLYCMALEVDPCSARANNNLAVLLMEASGIHYSEAQRFLSLPMDCQNEAALENAQCNRRILLMRMGKAAESEERFKRD